MAFPPRPDLEEAVKNLTAPPHQQNFFEDAYSLTKRGLVKTVETVEEHPGIAAAAAGAAVLLYLTRGKSLTGGIERASTQTAAETLTEAGAASKLTVQMAEREAVLKQVGAIPDVTRPMLDAAAARAVPEQFARAATEYEASLNSLKQLPLTHKVGAGQDMEALAREIMQGRSAVTGERLFPDTIAEEAKRLTLRNPALELKEGATLTVYAENDLAKLAEKTQFKHVPQLGQFLKEFGVTETQITRALDIQKAEPQATKRLLGQILTDEGLATKEQVDAAFGKQGALKKILADVRKASGF
ncbi:MAG: hypothetical protein JST01_29690 [Cyanobacteria bacterium SZAS TMP-1]|nr:hypothetical protein [Cyanobacteria bacterium SZAS TMP-1]